MQQRGPTGSYLISENWSSGTFTSSGERDNSNAAIWQRQMDFIEPATLDQSTRDFQFEILAKRLLRMGVAPDAACQRRKGYGVRSILVNGREYALSGGLFFWREISPDHERFKVRAVGRLKMTPPDVYVAALR